MSKTDLVVVGSVAYDEVETPYGSRDKLLGGSGTYFSVSASRFVTPGVVAVVGRDFDDADRAVFQRHEVDLAGLETDLSGDTFRWGGRYHQNMDDRTTLYTYLNVFSNFAPELPAAYRSASFLFLGNIAPELQLNVLDQVESPKFVALDTMNFWIEGKREELGKVLSKVQCLVINDEEGELLTGKRAAMSIATELQSMGPSTVILKRGEHGALLLHGSEAFYVPAFPLEQVVDPTGAGDTFAGGFVGYLARTGELTMDNLRRAMLTGSIMASFCVEGFGLERLERVTLDDIRDRYQDFVALTRCPDLTL